RQTTRSAGRQVRRTRGERPRRVRRRRVGLDGHRVVLVGVPSGAAEPVMLRTHGDALLVTSVIMPAIPHGATARLVVGDGTVRVGVIARCGVIAGGATGVRRTVVPELSRAGVVITGVVLRPNVLAVIAVPLEITAAS
ncbi:MAG: hypothetical protein ACRDSH_14875, partial [Pseudonocardiaceae bacterium]